MDPYRNSDPRPPIMAGAPPSLVPPRLEWDRAPWNRWSFQHIREVQPTAEVWRGAGPVAPLARAERNLDDLDVPQVGGGRGPLSRLLDDTYTDGFLLMQDGRVVVEQYFNGMGPRSLHLSQSVAKTITGAVAGRLIARGLLDPAAPVTDYLPELAATGWAGAALQHVLDMTTGVRFDETYTNPTSEMGQLDVASGWKPPPPGADPAFVWPGHVWELILSLKDQVRPHGARFEYRSIETDVLAFCMERVAGKRLPQLVSEELWQPMGAEESACFTVDPAGYALADGGFNATLRDYARFGQLFLSGDIVPPGWLAATRTRNGAEFPPEARATLPEGGYRNMTWLGNRDASLLLARGVFGQLIYIDLAHNAVAVKLSSWPEFLSPMRDVPTRGAIAAMIDVIG
ncbi:MAG: serine hydrolase [Rhodobacteraceae bacterium]|nr:serine hydrolase [Paracoccaceae bacterium]